MSPSLSIEALSHEVPDGASRKSTLAPLSRCFRPGAFYVIGGPSGVGKTTLLSLLSLAVPAASGAIRHGDVDLTTLPADEAARWRRHNVGLIFQTTRLMGVMTAREHIMLISKLRSGGRANTVEKGIELLNDMGLGDRLDHFPVHLSGGEKQRVAVAQAICFEPSVVLADEPTAALDAANAKSVGEMLARYAREHDAIVICVSHDAGLRDLADAAFDLERP